MDIIEKYEELTNAGLWNEALPIIKEIIERAPKIYTSWFNLGVCFDELGKYAEAAEAFIKAQALNVEDWGIHYRIMRSLFLAGDLAQLHEFADYSCGLSDQVIHLMCEDEMFGPLFERLEFQQLRAKYFRGK